MARAKNEAPAEVVIVSACLLGLRTRYDGRDCLRDAVLERTRGCCVIPVCPEQLGGLPTPRPPAELTGDGREVLTGCARVVRKDGQDVTENYLRGAQEALKMAQLCGARRAILKEKSPACGVTLIKLGGRDAQGIGVTAALLENNGIDLEGIE